ncbi:hypothetical protein NFJ02_01g40590 [Pycnococcus provasolii]
MYTSVSSTSGSTTRHFVARLTRISSVSSSARGGGGCAASVVAGISTPSSVSISRATTAHAWSASAAL